MTHMIVCMRTIHVQAVTTMIWKSMLSGSNRVEDGTLNILVQVVQHLLRSTTTQRMGESLLIKVPLDRMMKTWISLVAVVH